MTETITIERLDRIERALDAYPEYVVAPERRPAFIADAKAALALARSALSTPSGAVTEEMVEALPDDAFKSASRWAMSELEAEGLSSEDDGIAFLRSAFKIVARGGGLRLAGDRLATLSASSAPAPQSDGWRPIETCPCSSERMFDVWVYGGRYDKPTIKGNDGGFWRVEKQAGNTAVPTHWQPVQVPSPPGTTPPHPHGPAPEGEETVEIAAPSMSLRDWFAGMALSGSLADGAPRKGWDDHVGGAYLAADMMLARRAMPSEFSPPPVEIAGNVEEAS